MTLFKSFYLFFICLHIGFCEQITVAVSSNFIKPMQTISSKFDGTLRLVYGSSGKLYAQIINGAPYDLFFSADQQKPKILFDKKYTEIKPFTYAIGRLALYSTNASENTGSQLTLLNDLSLAIANPKLAPYGRAAIEVLDKIELHRKNYKKLIIGENVSQVFAFVSSGNVDLGFVALSQAIHQTDGDYWLVPNNYHKPIRQDAVILKSSKMSHRFIEFIKSEEIRSLIASYGYVWD